MTCAIEEVTEAFEQLSDADTVNMSDCSYQYFTSDHFWFQWRFSVLQDLLKKRELGKRVLEIGCGNAVASRQFEANYDVAVDGCDLNPAGLRVAEPGRGKLYLYNIHDRRPEWESAFDTILLLDTLEHIDDPVEFLRSVSFHLQKDGMILFNVPALNCLYSRYDEIAGHVKRYDKKILNRELTEAGLTLERGQYWGMTMIPVIFARRILANFVSQDRVYSSGFQPSRGAGVLLRSLMKFERTIFPAPWVGSSLAGVARIADK